MTDGRYEGSTYEVETEDHGSWMRLTIIDDDGAAGTITLGSLNIPESVMGKVIEGIGRFLADKAGDSAEADALPLGAPDGSVYDGPPCSELSTAGDWCGACPECEVAMAWIERMIARGPVIVDGVRFRAAPDHGCFYEWTDPDPNGSIGRLWMPMNVDGTPDVGSLGSIEVRYEDA